MDRLGNPRAHGFIGKDLIRQRQAMRGTFHSWGWRRERVAVPLRFAPLVAFGSAEPVSPIVAGPSARGMLGQRGLAEALGMTRLVRVGKRWRLIAEVDSSEPQITHYDVFREGPQGRDYLGRYGRKAKALPYPIGAMVATIGGIIARNDGDGLADMGGGRFVDLDGIDWSRVEAQPDVVRVTHTPQGTIVTMKGDPSPTPDKGIGYSMSADENVVAGNDRMRARAAIAGLIAPFLPPSPKQQDERADQRWRDMLARGKLAREQRRAENSARHTKRRT